MAKDTDFKFEEHIPWDSPDMSSKNFFENGRGHGHVTPKILGVKF